MTEQNRGMVAVRRGRPGPRVAPAGHSHLTVEINFVLSGSIRYFLGGRLREIAAGQWGIFWAGFPHRVVSFDPQTEMIWLYLPLPTLLSWELPGRFVSRLFEGRLLRHSPGTVRESDLDQRIALRWTVGLARGDRLRSSDRILLLELQAVVLRLARRFRQDASGSRKVSGRDTAHIERITRLIGARFDEPLRLADIAREIGLHAKYLTQLFKATCGMPLHRYLLQVRVAHAERLLLTTNRTVLDIAFTVGFGSASQFYEAFRRYAGCSPRAFRRQGA